MIFVDFSNRDPEGRRYVASLASFSPEPTLGETFEATDFEDFVGVECQVIAIDRLHGRVYHRPIRPADVPGTSESVPSVSLPAHFQDRPSPVNEVSANEAGTPTEAVTVSDADERPRVPQLS